MNNVSHKLFANCIPVKGARRSVICDLQKNRAHFIPNDLHDILCEKNGVFNIEELKEETEDDSHPVLQEYLDFLLTNKLVHPCTNPENFPKLDLTWQHPATITNAILDYNASSSYSQSIVLTQLEALGCEHVQFRFFGNVELSYLDELLSSFLESRFCSFEIFIPYSEYLTDAALNEFRTRHPRVMLLIIHSAPENRAITEKNALEYFALRKDVLTDASHCGFIHEDYFAVTLEVFSESQKLNSCLNRKISIDANGGIRNCPATEPIFGNIDTTTLQQALLHQNFKDLWTINKDQIEICRDCEFRYICTDCRAFITNPNNKYSKPSKCNYDPYTASWK